MMVFVSHWIPWSYQGGFPWNNFGVDLFFVLSGFLITDILLHGRRYMEGGEQGLFLTLRQFYVRRALRIFPLYVAFLLVYALTVPSFVNELTPWLWTYTLNLFRVLIDYLGGTDLPSVVVVGRGAVYLVWPGVILLTPRRFLLPVLLLSVAIGPATKVILGMNDVSGGRSVLHPVSYGHTGFGGAAGLCRSSVWAATNCKRPYFRLAHLGRAASFLCGGRASSNRYQLNELADPRNVC
jgi:peptidoglycan/LPS O-acetylase OafA/YrhL